MPYAYNNRGIAYAKLGQYQMAIEDYNKAIRLRPESFSMPTTTGDYLSLNWASIKWPSRTSTKLSLLKPDNADAYNNRGTIYTKFGQYQIGH